MFNEDPSYKTNSCRRYKQFKETGSLHERNRSGCHLLATNQLKTLETVSFNVLRNRLVNVLESWDFQNLQSLRFQRNFCVLLVINFNCYRPMYKIRRGDNHKRYDFPVDFMNEIGYYEQFLDRVIFTDHKSLPVPDFRITSR